MYCLLSICLILLLFIIFYNDNNSNECDDDIDINKYNIIAKKHINQDDKYNIKQYDIINDNIIIHSKYKNELLNLKKYKKIKDKEENDQKIQMLEKRNQEIKINSEKLKIQEFNKKIKKLKLNIQSLKLSLKIELKNFLNDYNQNKISSNEIKIIIYNLKKELENNNKLLYNNDDYLSTEYIKEYNNLINIKKVLLEKKINIFAKFLK
jgi:hypothetical protein